MFNDGIAQPCGIPAALAALQFVKHDCSNVGIPTPLTGTLYHDGAYRQKDGNFYSGIDFVSAPVLTVADKVLTVNLANSNRTLTFSGNPTISDWFDQSVKQAASPTYGGLTLNGAVYQDSGLYCQKDGATFYGCLDFTSTTGLTGSVNLTVDLDNATRILKLQGNLTVEGASLINQDLTDDSTVARLQTLTLGLNGVGGYVGTLTVCNGLNPGASASVVYADIGNWNTAFGWGNHALAGYLVSANPVPATKGGTGVSNNAANTLTFTGNFSLGLTLTGNTALTLPTSGYLAYSAGTSYCVIDNYINQDVRTTGTPQFARIGVGAAAHATNIATLTSTDTTASGSVLNIAHSGSITGSYTGINYVGSAVCTVEQIGQSITLSGAGLANTCLKLSATGGTTNNYGLLVTAGNVGIGNTAPANGLDLGSVTAGLNGATWATLGAELCPSFAGGNWTAAGGWSATGTTLAETSNAGPNTIQPNPALTITGGSVYKVVITASATSGSIYYSLGGNYGNIPITATTITDYITSNATGNFAIYGAASSTATITAVSIKKLTASTGNWYVGQNLNVYGQAYFYGQYAGFGTTTPTKKLHVIGASNGGIFLKQNTQVGLTSGTCYNGLTFENTTTTHAFFMGYHSGGYFSLNYFDSGTAYTNILNATTSAVGIGVVATATNKLDVLQTSTTTLSTGVNILHSGLVAGGTGTVYGLKVGVTGANLVNVGIDLSGVANATTNYWAYASTTNYWATTGILVATYHQTATAITANSSGTVGIVAKDANLLTNNVGWLPLKKSDGAIVYVPVWS